jgi:hypothetical protein
MGKIVVTEFVSMDRIVEDPGGAEAGAPARAAAHLPWPGGDAVMGW